MVVVYESELQAAARDEQLAMAPDELWGNVFEEELEMLDLIATEIEEHEDE